MLTFPIYVFTNKISQKNQKKFRGYPPFSPLKSKASQSGPPMTAYNPYFLFRNLILLQKWGCLQKRLEMNILKFDRALTFLVKKKMYCFLENLN